MKTLQTDETELHKFQHARLNITYDPEHPTIFHVIVYFSDRIEKPCGHLKHSGYGPTPSPN